jgi:hypothetical protein
MKKQTITDLTFVKKPSPPPVGIVLTAALQDEIPPNPNAASRPEFGVIDGGTIGGTIIANTKTGYDMYLENADSITRVARLVKYDRLGDFGQDVIIVDGVLFLGRWNDGVVVKQR